MRHRLQHLSGDDHGFPAAHRILDQRFLQDGNAFDRRLDAQVAARHHDAVGSGKDFIDVVQCAGALDLGKYQGASAE